MITTEDIIALRESIDHWYTNLMLAYAGEIDIHDVTDLECDLCELDKKIDYNNAYAHDDCRFCALVKLECCESSCEGSPYRRARQAIKDASRSNSPDWNGVAVWVIEEIRFLENALERAMSERMGVWG